MGIVKTGVKTQCKNNVIHMNYSYKSQINVLFWKYKIVT